MKLSLSAQCILALVLGIVAGTAASQLHPEALAPWLDAGSALIQLWTNALRMLVIPLVVSQLFVTVAGHDAGEDSAILGWSIPVVFVGLMVFTAAISLTLGSLLISIPVVKGLSLTSAAGSAAAAAAPVAADAPYQWLTDLVQPNLFAAASANAILPLMLFTFIFGVAARRLTAQRRDALYQVAAAVRETIFVIVGWLMRLAPPIVFILAFRSGSRFGPELGGALAAFLVLWTILLVAQLAVQYPVAWLVGGVPVSRFARAVFPAQMAAFASRSSLATVPVLMRESEVTLRIPSKVSSLVVPTSAAVMKLSQAISPPLRLLFLASVLGISLEPRQVLIFMLTILVLSPGVVGIPRMVSSSGRSLPAYIAAGIPPEYVLLFGPLNALIDPLLTAVNTTGYMTVNVLVARRVLGKFGFRSDAPAPTQPMAESPSSLPAAPKLN